MRNRSQVITGQALSSVPLRVEQSGTEGTGPPDYSLFQFPPTPLRGVPLEQSCGGTDPEPGTGRPAPWFIFSVVGVPRPRPRVRARWDGGIIYTPSTADIWMHEIRAGVKLVLLQQPAVAEQVPVRDRGFGVALEFRMPRPRAHYRTGKFAGELRPAKAGLPHLGTPDLDNLEKAVLDALGRFDKLPVMIWCDDAQVVSIASHKRYTVSGEAPGLTAAVYRLENEPL